MEPAGDSFVVAPSGCLQFYNQLSGTVRSFNYGSSSVLNGTRQLAGMNYGVCVNMFPGRYEPELVTYDSLRQLSNSVTHQFQLSTSKKSIFLLQFGSEGLKQLFSNFPVHYYTWCW